MFHFILSSSKNEMKQPMAMQMVMSFLFFLWSAMKKDADNDNRCPCPHPLRAPHGSTVWVSSSVVAQLSKKLGREATTAAEEVKR